MTYKCDENIIGTLRSLNKRGGDMEKIIYLLWASEGREPDQIKKILLDECAPRMLELGTRMRYVRNAVARPLTTAAPPLLGIVDEAFPSAAHLTAPRLFFCADGSKEKLKENILRMAQSVLGFLDLDRIRSFAMSEYLLKT